jgi:S-adenosylmethionine-diacylgycerolhomoserine-N-methlytransferase
MLWGQKTSGPLGERLESFYAPQAADYDATRENLLRGRRELAERLAPPPGASLVDIGAGTGKSLEFFGERVATLSEAHLVDLSPSLLAQAQKRCERNGWSHVRTVQADTTTWRPPRLVDCVHISYSITMVPNWFQVIDNAVAMLKPGGLLGVVDFYVARRLSEGTKHGWLARHFWPAWFEHDGVNLSSEHVPYLCHRVEKLQLVEERGGLFAVPYYIFVGRNRGRD